jgi:signal transduction histidine kinase
VLLAAAPAPAPALASPTPAQAPPRPSADAVPIVVDGHRVGSVVFGAPLPTDSATGRARGEILDALWIGVALAVVLAAAAALLVSRRVSRPLVALVAATGALERGSPDATSRLRAGPGELGQLSRAFDRMARTLRREDELRRALVADVAHELRTPVTILLGLTEELLDGLTEPTPERLASLHDEVLRLGRLVDDLATLSAAQAAGLALQRQPVDLAQTVEQVLDVMQPQFDDSQLTVEIRTAPLAVIGDDARLRQVLTNLLTNAVKFTPAGGRVLVEVRREGDEAVVTVADTGPGIPADELPHIFDRFWRGRAAAGRAGSGIGLAVVAALVEAHGGTVAAESAPGGGARFTVRLPAG